MHADYKFDEVQGYELVIDANPVIEIFKDHQNRIIELRHLRDEQLVAQAAPIFTTSLLKAYAHISAEDLKLDKNNTLKERLDNFFQKEELESFSQKKFFAIGALF